MNVNVRGLNDAMTLAKRGRLIAPHHYACATNMDWYAARNELRKLAQCGFLEAVKNGCFRVLEFSVDD